MDKQTKPDSDSGEDTDSGALAQALTQNVDEIGARGGNHGDRTRTEKQVGLDFDHRPYSLDRRMRKSSS